MDQVTELKAAKSQAATPAPFFVQGRVVDATEVRHRSRDLDVDFVTPKIDLDALISPRTEPGPLFDVKLDEILDFLVATGQAMKRDKNGYLQQAVERISVTNVLPRAMIESQVRMAADYLNKPVSITGLRERISALVGEARKRQRAAAMQSETRKRSASAPVAVHCRLWPAGRQQHQRRQRRV